MKDTGIEWADHTINFFVGCKPISPGCAYCYANAIESRFKRDFSILRKTDWVKIQKMLAKIKSSRIFADSMTDMFLESVPYGTLDEIFDIIKLYPQHKFLILTKRIVRAVNYFRSRKIPDNVWMGVSVESGDYRWLSRIDLLRLIDASVRFVSFEPLIGPVSDVDLTGIQWAIVGGESGVHARPIKEEWVLRILDICRRDNAAFFFKQWGGRFHNSNGRTLLGKEFSELPMEVVA